jgi:hypothetical protein
LGISAEPNGQDQEHGIEIMAITGLLDPNMNWWKLISEYLWLRMIPDDKIKTWRLVHWAKGYIIHDSELCHHSYDRTTSRMRGSSPKIILGDSW